MKEYLPENESPVNQAAKKALRQLNLKPDPEDLYLFQLMDWSLEKKKVALRGPYRVSLEHQEAYSGLRWHRDRKEVMRVFEENPAEPEEESELVKLAEKKGPLSAVALAQEGWEALAEWMSENGLWEDSPIPGDSGL